jgi:hypothetical protein
MTPGNRQQCSGAKSSRIKFSCEDERNVVAVANPFLEGVFLFAGLERIKP